MFKLFKNTSISKQYLIFAITLPFTLLLIIISNSYSSYKEIQNVKYNNYWHLADQIFEVIDTGFNYIFDSFNNLDSSISTLKHPRPEAINKVFYNYFNRLINKKNTILAKGFYFIAPDGNILAKFAQNSHNNLSLIKAEHSNWLSQTSENPHHWIILKPSDGDQHITQNFNDNVLNTIWGVSTQHGIFLGYILASLNLKEIKLSIQKLLKDEGIDFILLDDSKKIIASSLKNLDITSAINLNYNKLADAGILKTPLKIENSNFNYFMELRPYPLTVLLGMNNYEKAILLQRSFLSHLFEALGIGAVLFLLLYFFRSRLINPISILSDKALEISQGNVNVEIPSSFQSIEASNLANALALVKDSFIRDQLIKKDLELTKELLEKALNEVNEAKRVKILFVSTLVNEITTPLRFILTHAQDRSTIEANTPQEHASWQRILDTSDFIKNLIVDLQNYTESEDERIFLVEKIIDLQKIFENIIGILQSYINEKKVQIILSITDKTRYMLADELKIKQILLNIFNYLLNDASPEDQIIIETKINRTVELNFLRTSSSNRVSPTYPMYESNSTQDNFVKINTHFFSVSIARKLVELHDGTLKLDHILDIGKTIKIEFPYFRFHEN